MAGCASLRLLTTSRQALRVTGETVWTVPSLSVPHLRESQELGAVARADAVRLFVARAASVVTGFALMAQNAPVIAHLCRRLDGIPLAIELAAARTKILSPEQIATRLDDRFHLLTQGNRAALPRQQTLRAAVDWSYDLLSEPERLLLARLSIFAGGWTLEAAEAICSDDGLDKADILDVLTELVDRSLVVVETDSERQRRYRLLETMRDYGRQRLEEHQCEERMQRRHRLWFRQLAEQAETGCRGLDQATWFNRLASEHDNLRVALRDYLTQGEARIEDGSDPGLHLANVLRPFWETRGYCREGRQWLQSLLDSEIGLLVERACAYKNIGLLAMGEADTETACRSRLAAAQRQEVRAVRLCSAANALRAAIGTPLPRAERLKHQRALDNLCETLGEAVFAREWEMGQAMSLEETMAYALRAEFSAAAFAEPS